MKGFVVIEKPVIDAVLSSHPMHARDLVRAVHRLLLGHMEFFWDTTEAQNANQINVDGLVVG